MNILGKAYGYALAALAFIASIAGIFLAGRKAGGDSVKLKVSEKTREIEHKATDAVVDGTKSIDEARHVKIDPNRSGFDRD